VVRIGAAPAAVFVLNETTYPDREGRCRYRWEMKPF
jgi:hypothetical protein